MHRPTYPQPLNGKTPKIAVIGLGYVGLPLALEFSRCLPVTGLDISERRVAQLRQARDVTREVEPEALQAAERLVLTTDPADLAGANVYIVTVPTPIDEHRRPDLGPLIAASTTIGKVLKPGDVVIYESTVYPGCTEEDCVPILEAQSGLACAFESRATGTAIAASPIEGWFFAGYSPERINPGDRRHRLPDIRKITSGSTPRAAEFIDGLYARIITAGTHKAPSIRVAEAAKVIENTQRDVNIGLINELAMLFGKMGLDTADVLDAACTKWNFLPFRPGLVGGHCIGVDPYYLTHKAQQIGFHPQMILAGRRTNDGMGAYVAGEVLKLMARKGVYQPDARVLILGLTFKENCPDLRNTRVVDLVRALQDYQLEVDVHDPWADPDDARQEYDLELVAEPEQAAYGAVILAVAHDAFRQLGSIGVQQWGGENAVVYDLKHMLPKESSDARL